MNPRNTKSLKSPLLAPLISGLLFLFSLTGCDSNNKNYQDEEIFVFFVQYTNAAFGPDFRALYINSDGEVIKAEDSELPTMTLDGSYTQSELEDYFFPNQSLLTTISDDQLAVLVQSSVYVDPTGLEEVSDSQCEDAGTYRYGFYNFNTTSREYEETLLYVTGAPGIELNSSIAADTITEFLMVLATDAEIAYPSAGPCAGYWTFD